MKKVKCGDANPNGNIALNYKGGCGKELDMKDAYRCTGCGGWFHLDCILKHFKLEKEHDVGRNELKNLIKIKIHKKYHATITEKEILKIIDKL